MENLQTDPDRVISTPKFTNCGRFLTALLIAVALGAGLYFAMHFIVQPIANQLDPISRSREESQSIQQQDNIPNQPKTEAQSFNARKFIRGLFSVAKQCSLLSQ